MKKLIFWASVLLLAGAVASCEPQTPQEPENSAQPESPENPDTPSNPEESNNPQPPEIEIEIAKVTNYSESINGTTFSLIGVEGGVFQMGATPEQVDEFSDREKPVHFVTLSSFYLSQTEVTQEQYLAIMGNNPSRFEGDNLPVEKVCWTDAKAFCEKLSQLSGKRYVLPTEAQWEYAARGGIYKENTKYAGSNNVDKVSWSFNDINEKHTYPVASKAPNALGLYDMSGNVWEWCSDCYGDYLTEPQINPIGPENGEYPILRGGGWNSRAICSRVSYRGYMDIPFKSDDIGFRIAMIP